MRNGIALIAIGLMMGACSLFAPQSTQQAQTAYVQACASYNAIFSVALQLRMANKLSPDQIKQITLLDSQITPICTGPLPADPTFATQQITTAVTTLGVLEAISQAKPK